MMQRTSRSGRRSVLLFLLACTNIFLVLAPAVAPARAQSAAADPAQPATAQPVSITLEEAIHRAQANEPGYATAMADSRSAALDRSIARAGLLPSARVLAQGIHTQPNGLYSESDEGVSTPNPKFVANDSRPNEYFAQGIVDETLSVAGFAAVRRADATAAMARAQLEIARRGLLATVTGLFYGSLAADHKVEIAQRAWQEAADFSSLTTKRENQREAAHADVVKAQLTEQQQWRALQDAKLAAQTARLDLGVLLFTDPRTPYTLQSPQAAPLLEPFPDVEAAAAKNSPELKSALANLKGSDADVFGAHAAYLPTLGLNLTYGIDANEFATNGPLTPTGARARNLGSSTTWTVNLPIWDWLSTENKVKQSEIRRDVARVALSAAQRQLLANLQEYYATAQTAQEELQSLDASVATAEESLRLTKMRYTGGEGTVLEVVDAQTAVVTAANAREDGRIRYQNALANLQTLTGTK
jgi:outer membrane protein TolC